MGNKKTLLVIDDDKLFCDAISDYMEGEELNVIKAHTGAGGVELCARKKVDVVLLDQNLPDAAGHTFCPDILSYNEQAKIIFVTAHPSFEGAIKAIRAGAHDYLSKPFDPEELLLTVRNALKTIALEKVAQIESYKAVKESEDTVLVGKSLADMHRLIDLAASSEASVLITGETGTGKNVLAKSIHFKGRMKKEAFISINCAAIPENLIEAELFGFEKGAFTGAFSTKKGIFEMAEGGTLFLDEIAEMPMHLQTKLLSVLEDKKLRRLGGDAIRPVNVRVIAATSAEMEGHLDKKFRSDLYFRLSVIRIHIPPLRERKQDIPELCEYLLGKITYNRDIRLRDEELKKLMVYDWPGNVRELKNVLDRAFILRQSDDIRPSDFLWKGQASAKQNPAPVAGFAVDDSIAPLEEIEKQYITKTLERLSGNQTRTAKALGVSISTLKRKVAQYRSVANGPVSSRSDNGLK